MRKFILLTFLCVLCVGCSAGNSNTPVSPTPGADSIIEETSPPSQSTQPIPERKPQYPQILTPTLTDSIDFVITSEGQFCIYDGKKYGFMSETGKEITPYIYDYAYPFSEGLACCYRDGKYGFIDYDGNEALPFIYDKANSFSEGLAYFEIGDKYGFIDKSGNEAFLLNCDSASSFKEGLSYFSINGKYGYIDKAGKEVIKAKYDDVGYFENGLAKMRLDDKIGVIDKNGNEITPAKYDNVTIDNEFIVTELDNKYGCIDKTGKLILPPKYDNIDVQNKHICFEVNEKNGLADKNGTIILKPIYRWINTISENSIIVGIDDKCGLVDSLGNIQVPLKYDSINYSEYSKEQNQQMLVVELNNKFGVLSLSDYSEVLPLVYDSVNCLNNNRFTATLNNKYGVIDKKGDVIIPFEYENILVYDNGMLELTKDDKFGLADSNGKILVPIIYDNITQTGNCYEIEVDDKYGLLNENGEITIPLDDDNISIYYNNVYKSKNFLVATKDNPQLSNVIIKTADYQDVDLSELLLKNEITPKIKLFNNHIKSYRLTTPFSISERDTASKLGEFINCIKTFKLYDVDGSGKPILYLYAKPVEQSNYSASYSCLFSIKDNQVNELLTGYEGGDTTGGDYICLFKDNQSSKIVLGTSDHVGGFGGNAYGSDYYAYKNGKVNKITSYECISQASRNCKEKVLLKNASLFYDENGNPFTKDTILQAETVTEYSINDKQSTVDDYNKVVGRFKSIPLDMWR